MQCPKCGHSVLGYRERCMYCGTFVTDQIAPVAKKSSNTVNDNVHVKNDGKGSITVSVDKKIYKKLEDIPESLRHKVEEAIKEGGMKHFIEEKTFTKNLPEFESNAIFGTKPLDNTLDALAKINNLLDGGQIKQPIYRKMAIGIIKDFINSFDDDLKLSFVINQIKDSPFASYIDDEIYNELTQYFILKASEKD